jgi:hypothetical protein
MGISTDHASLRISRGLPISTVLGALPSITRSQRLIENPCSSRTERSTASEHARRWNLTARLARNRESGLTLSV